MQREIDNIGMYVSKDLDRLFHLEVKLKKLKRNWKMGKLIASWRPMSLGKLRQIQ